MIYVVVGLLLVSFAFGSQLWHRGHRRWASWCHVLAGFLSVNVAVWVLVGALATV